MTWDEFVYALMLLISLVAGPFHHKIENKHSRLMFGTIVGVMMVFIICGTFIYHSFLTVFVNGIIIFTFPKRYRTIASFVWCFGYISFFRTTHWFGLEKVPPHSNAVQLLITLKLVGIAFEMSDTEELRSAVVKEKSAEKELELTYRGVYPSPFEYFHYAYCYIGLLTGPYFKFRVFKDMINQSRDYSIPIKDALLNRLWQAPVYGFIYLALSHFYVIEYAKTEEFFGRSFAYRLLYMVIMFILFRLRMYFAWIMSECVCMAAGLGAYPEISLPRSGAGPTDLKALDQIKKNGGKGIIYNFETIHNIDVWATEFSSTVRDGMKAWNMSVQYWLAFFIYKRVPMRSTRTFWTMSVSAYWHGVKPGYFLSFFTVPLCLMAESVLSRLLPPGQINQWITWFFKMRCFDYMAMSFLLLDFWPVINYWSSIFFIVHVAIATLLIIGAIVKPKRS